MEELGVSISLSPQTNPTRIEIREGHYVGRRWWNRVAGQTTPVPGKGRSHCHLDHSLSPVYFIYILFLIRTFTSPLIMLFKENIFQ